MTDRDGRPRRLSGRWWAVLVLAGLAALAGPARPEEPPATSHEEALRLLEQGRAGEAALALQDLLGRARAAGASLPEQAALASDLGWALHRAGESYAALQHLEAACDARGGAEDHLRHAEALLQVARDHMASGAATSFGVEPYLRDAVGALERAREAGAPRARRLALEAEARYWLGEAEEAVGCWERAPLEDLPSEAGRRARELWGHALYGLGRHEEAAERFLAAGNRRAAASAWAAAGRGEEAISTYGELLRAAPGDGALLEEALAAAAYTESRPLLAEVLSALVAEDGPARARLLTARGLLAEALGREDEARLLFETAAGADATTAAPLVHLGRLRLAQEDVPPEAARDAAAEAWLEALARSPGEERARALLWELAGQDYRAAWRSPPALLRSLRVQEALVAASPDDALALANLGNSFRVAGRLEEALEAYDRAREADPFDPAIASDRGLALSALGRGAEALEAFLDAVRLDPAFEAARQNAARWLYREGRYESAAEHLGRALGSARATGRGWMRYRHLLDRVERARRRPDAR